VFSDFSFKFSNYTVLEAKCVRNWKSEILWWAHYLVRNKKIVKFCVYRPWSLDMSAAYAPRPLSPARPPPARPVPPRNTWPRHATETHRAHQWEIGRLVDGVGEDASHMHAPRIPYRLGINGTVWGFGLSTHFKLSKGYRESETTFSPSSFFHESVYPGPWVPH
jgi:hypothetical protein